LLVEKDGLAGFVPFSHLIELAGKEHEVNRDVSLESYVGKTLNVKVIECVPEDGRVVFSERAALAEPGKRAELFHNLSGGKRTRGTVTNITDFGVFVDLGSSIFRNCHGDVSRIQTRSLNWVMRSMCRYWIFLPSVVGLPSA
jgi:ribosomal protein S1